MSGLVRSKIMFGVVSGWGSQLVSLALGIFTMPLFFRHLQKEELGVWMFILGTGFFVNLADLGFSPVLGRQLAFELGKGDREKNPNYDGSSYYYSLSTHVAALTSYLLFFGMLLIGGLFIWSLQIPDRLITRSIEAWTIFCLSQGVTCRFKYLETVLNSHGEVGWQNWVQTILQSLTLAAYFVVLHLCHGGIIALSTIVLVRNILNSFCLWLLVDVLIDKRFRAKADMFWRDVKPHLVPALDYFLITVGAFLVLNTDQYFIVRFLGMSALPDYAAAYRLVQVVYTFASTASGMCMPFISRVSSAGDWSGLHKMLMLNTTVGMIIQVAAVSLLAVFGDHILQLWLGKGHFVGWGVLWVFCIMLTLENHHVIFARFGLSAKTDPTWGKMSLIAGAINLALTYIGVKWLGLLGVALGTMIAQILTNNWYAVVKTLKIIHLRFSRYINGSGIVWFATGVILLVILSCIRLLMPWPVASLLTGMAVTMLVCSGIIYLYLKNVPVAGQ